MLALLAGETLPAWDPPASPAEPATASGQAPRLSPVAPPAEVASAARRVVSSVPAPEREAIARPGGAAFASLVAARIALAAAAAEGKRALASRTTVLVDGDAEEKLAQLADAAASRLQAEVDQAMKSGQREALQLALGARAALNRDRNALKLVADQLRGLGARASAGADGLDPEVRRAPDVRAASAPPAKPAAAKPKAASEFPDYSRKKPKRAKEAALAVLGFLLVVRLLVGPSIFAAHAPSVLRQAEAEAAGEHVVRVAISRTTAVITVKPAFLEHPGPEVAKVVEALRPHGVERAMLILESGAPVGQIDVSRGTVVGLAQLKAAPHP